MKSDIIARTLRIILLMTLAVMLSANYTFAKLTIPIAEIPSDISEKVKENMEKLYATVALNRARAAYGLGVAGMDAAKAVPFLLQMLDDMANIKWSESPNAELGLKATTVSAIVLEALEKIGSHDLDPFIKALFDGDRNIRMGVADILGNIGDPKAVGPLIVVLNDKDDAVREKVTQALMLVDDPVAVESLVAVLNDSDENVRKYAAEALNDIEPGWHDSEEAKRAIPGFIATLKDDDGTVRKNSAEALSVINPDWRNSKEAKLIVPEYINILKQGDKYIREKAAWVLGMLKDPRSIKPLLYALNDSEESVRANAALALGALNEKKAIGPLIIMLTGTNKELMRKIAATLNEIDNDWRNSGRAKEVVPELVKILQDKDKDVRKNSVDVLKQIGWEPSNQNEKISYLIAVQEWAELVKIDKPAGKPLVPFLKDEDKEVIKNVAWALGRIRYKGAIVPLINALRDDDEDVKKSIGSALWKITGKNYGENRRRWIGWWKSSKRGK